MRLHIPAEVRKPGGYPLYGVVSRPNQRVLGPRYASPLTVGVLLALIHLESQHEAISHAVVFVLVGAAVPVGPEHLAVDDSICIVVSPLVLLSV